MQSIRDILSVTPDATDAEVAAAYNAQPPAAKPGEHYETFVSLGRRKDLFGDGASNVAGSFRKGLKVWLAAPELPDPYPNLGVIETVVDRLAGARGLDFSDADTPGLLSLFAMAPTPAHPAIVTAEQAAALLSLGYDVVTPVAPADVAAERARVAREAVADGYAAAVYGYLNDVLNVARVDPAAPLPSPADYFGPAGGRG